MATLLLRMVRQPFSTRECGLICSAGFSVLASKYFSSHCSLKQFKMNALSLNLKCYRMLQYFREYCTIPAPLSLCVTLSCFHSFHAPQSWTGMTFFIALSPLSYLNVWPTSLVCLKIFHWPILHIYSSPLLPCPPSSVSYIQRIYVDIVTSNVRSA